MTEQVVSGGLSEAANDGNKSIKQQKQDNQDFQQIDGEITSSSLLAAEANNNNSTTCLESGALKCETEKGENERKQQSGGNQNSHNQHHHRHRRHSNSNNNSGERTAANKFAKSARQSSSSSASSSSSFESSATSKAAPAAGEPELCGQRRCDVVAPATGATSDGGAAETATQPAPSSQCLSSSSSSSSLQQVVVAAATCQTATTSEQVSPGDSLQNCSSNIALLPIVADCDSTVLAENQKTGQQQQQQQQVSTTSNASSANNNNQNNSYLQQDTNNNNCQRRDSKTQNNNSSYNHTVDNHQLLQNDSTCKQWSITSSGDQFCKRRKLSYFQSLLLRKWPCLAISICIMSSLLFGILLSALTVYLLHGATDCSGLARVAAANAESNSPPHLLLAQPNNPHQLLRRPEFASDSAGLVDQLASLTGSSSSSGSEHSGQLRAAASSGSDSTQPAARFQRLPSSLWPIHYDLFIQPYIAEPFNFTGKVSLIC